MAIEFWKIKVGAVVNSCYDPTGGSVFGTWHVERFDSEDRSIPGLTRVTSGRGLLGHSPSTMISLYAYGATHRWMKILPNRRNRTVITSPWSEEMKEYCDTRVNRFDIISEIFKGRLFGWTRGMRPLDWVRAVLHGSFLGTKSWARDKASFWPSDQGKGATVHLDEQRSQRPRELPFFVFLG